MKERLKITREKMRGQDQERTSSEELNSGHRDAITPCVKASTQGGISQKRYLIFLSCLLFFSNALRAALWKHI